MCAASQDHLTYDFTSDDNKQKWKGIFVSALEKVKRYSFKTAYCCQCLAKEIGVITVYTCE